MFGKISIVIMMLLLSSCRKSIPESADATAAEKLLATSAKPLTINGNVYFFGDSITYGYSDNGPVSNNWVNLFSDFTNCNGHNLGISGTTMERTVNYGVAAQSMYIRALQEIPTKSANDKFLFFSYGMNDVGFNFPDLNTDQFKADYQYVLNIAINKGWEPKDIVIVNIFYCLDRGFSIYGITPQADLARQSTFNAVIQDIAVKNNTRFVDIYSFMKSYGADYLISSDGLHPNETGYAVIARGMIEAVRTF